MKIFQRLFLFILATFTIVSCKNIPEQVTYIPDHAASVIVVNMDSVFNKTQIRDTSSVIRLMNHLANYGFSNETFDLAVTSVFASKEPTGLDMQGELMAYLLPSVEFRNAYRCLSLNVTDSSVFAEHLRSSMSANYIPLENVENCVCYINSNDRFSWIAYNDKVAIFGCSALHTKGNVECINSLFDPKTRKLSSNKDFYKFLKNRKEANVWISTTELLELYDLWFKELPTILSSDNIPRAALEGNYIHIFSSFDSAVHIDVDCNSSFSFRHYWRNNNFGTSSFDPSIARYIPQNTLWLSTFSIEPRTFLKQIINTESCKYAETELAKLNITLEDLACDFTGDCVFNIYDICLENIRSMQFVPSKVGTTMIWKHLQKEEKTTFPHLAFVLKMKDDKRCAAVLRHISTNLREENSPGVFDFTKAMGFPAFIVCRDNLLFISTDKNYACAIATGNLPTDEGSAYTIAQKGKGLSSYQYLDFSIANYPETLCKYLEKMEILPLVTSYSSIVKSAEVCITNSYTGSVTIEFQDSTQNSLTQLQSLLQIVLP